MLPAGESTVRDAADEGPADHASSLPYAKAFIVQFASETDVQAGQIRGRIEHLQSGRRSRFTSSDELLARIMAMLAAAASRDE
jgi:hypothetical protein